MIKAKVSDSYKEIERIFAGGTIQKEILKVWSTEADAYVFEAWKILEMEGPLPLTITTNGEPLIDYRIYGNTVQNGTPTPENPITPIGCGERVDIIGLSEPLCGIETYTDNLNLSTGILTRRIKKLVLTGEEQVLMHQTIVSWFQILLTDIVINGLGLCTHYTPSPYIPANMQNGEIFVGKQIATDKGRIVIRDTAYSSADDFKSYLAAQYAAGTPVTVWYVLDEPEVSTISIPSGLTRTIEGYLIQNDTPTPENPIYPTANGAKQADDTYSIPYGYKLPILSNSTVTNIYLGEVETTRRIKKLVLTGEELWTLAYSNIFRVTINSYLRELSALIASSTHYTCAPNISTIGELTYDKEISFLTSSSGNNYMYVKDGSFASSVDNLKQFLSAQYAAGTPVTVWYVLDEPETGIVNEPLMKIGDYADTIDSAQAAVQIQTYKGNTTLDYDGEDHFITSDGYELVDKNQNSFLLSGSTLRPSKMYMKYKGR